VQRGCSAGCALTASIARACAAPRREAFRTKLAVLLEHRLFYIPSFKIYGARAHHRRP
jgi:hypothetical protein